MAATSIPPAQNEKARRNSRFKFAQDRIQKIADAAPPFTQEQLDTLTLIIRSAPVHQPDAASR